MADDKTDATVATDEAPVAADPEPEVAPDDGATPEVDPEDLPDHEIDWLGPYLDHHASLRINRAYPDGPWVASIGHLPHHADRLEIAGSGPSVFHAMRELEQAVRAYRREHPVK